MELKPGNKIIIRWPPGANGKAQSAFVLSVPGEDRSHYQIQFERVAQKRTLTKSELEKILVKVVEDRDRELKVSIGAALAIKGPKPREQAVIGARVTIERDDGSRRKYTLVPPGQGNQENNEIDPTVPIGAALLTAREGDELEVNEVIIKVISVELPDSIPVIKPVSRIGSIDVAELEQDKLAVIQGDISENMVVMAPPGTGKSFTLAYKVARQIQSNGVSPGEILVLSFSREAVAEVKRRLQRFSIHNVNLVQPFTIDSFAAGVLFTEKRKYVFESYDKSIADALELLKPEVLAKFKHIFVDEFQDIVGIRAEFITKIFQLKPEKCGVTLLGDIEQSIYHWSLKGQESQRRSEEFLVLSATILGTGNNVRYLTKNFRVSNPSLKQVMNEFRDFLEKETPSLSANVGALSDAFLKRVRGLDVLAETGREKYKNILKPADGIRKCVLFRDNGQLIAEASLAQNLGLKPKMLGKHNRGLMPAWYAILTKYFHARSKFLDWDSFADWFNRNHFDDAWESESAWKLLKSIEGAVDYQRDLDLLTLKKRIQYLRDVPMPESELKDLYESSLVFSTYHASKGLEFEQVYLVEPDCSGFENYNTFLDEARMFYVGLTRAKEQIHLIPGDGIESLRSIAYPVGRVEEKRWYKTDSAFRYFNADNEFDVDVMSFIMSFGFTDVDEVQDLLTKSVKEGDPLELRLCEPPKSGFYKGYFIFWKDKALGSMSRSFYDSILRLYRQTPPRVINSFVGKKYAEFRSNPYGAYPYDQLYTDHYESWLAIKLGGLAQAVR